MYHAAGTTTNVPSVAEQRVRLESPQKRQELAREAIQAGQTERSQRRDKEDRRQPGQARGQAAEVGQPPCAGARLDIARDEEERRDDDAVIDHLHDSALDALHIEREDAKDDDAHMADADVGQQPLEVLRHQRFECEVENADDGENRDQRRELVRRVGEERQAEAHEAIDAGLGHHARDQHDHCRRSLAVGVRHPTVEREEPSLDGERACEGQEE